MCVHLNLNLTTTTKTQIVKLKQTKDLNRHFSKDDVQVAKKHMKKYSSLVIREMSMKSTMRHCFTPPGMAIIFFIGKQQVLVRVWRKWTFMHCW
jgi:hypothetical protein